MTRSYRSSEEVLEKIDTVLGDGPLSQRRHQQVSQCGRQFNVRAFVGEMSHVVMTAAEGSEI